MKEGEEEPTGVALGTSLPGSLGKGPGLAPTGLDQPGLLWEEEEVLMSGCPSLEWGGSHPNHKEQEWRISRARECRSGREMRCLHRSGVTAA